MLTYVTPIEVANAKLELRNKVYEYAFNDGKSATLAFLQTCRQVWHEASTFAFGTAALNLNHRSPTVGNLKTISKATRSAVRIVHYRHREQTANTKISLIHRANILPVHVVHSWSVTPVSKPLLRMWVDLMVAQSTVPCSNFSALVYAHFLFNKRLQDVRLIGPKSASNVSHNLIMVREGDSDVSIGRSQFGSAPGPNLHSGGYREWLKGLKVIMVRSRINSNGDVVVRVEHEQLAGQSATLRVRVNREEAKRGACRSARKQ